MLGPVKGTRWSVAGVAVLGLLLIALAFLEHRWIRQLSEAEGERLQSQLEGSVGLFQRALALEVAQAGANAPPEPTERPSPGRAAPPSWEDVQSSLAVDTELVADSYVAERNSRGGLSFLEYWLESGEWEKFRPSDGVAGALERCMTPATTGPPPPGGGRGMNLTVVLVKGENPIVVRAFPRPPPERPAPPQGREAPERYQILELDTRYLRTTLLPELLGRSFGAVGFEDYDVGVILHGDSEELLYQSRPGLTSSHFDAADTRVAMFSFPAVRPGEGGLPSERSRGRPIAPGPGGPTAVCGESDAWELVVRHRAGSVGQAVAGLRNRNLAMSGGVLVLLAISVVMMILSTRRAQRLAKAHMEFAAGVSHELRTPLAVIRSAADNLAEGAVTQPDQIKKYGALVRREGRRLSEMVDATLQFASSQARRISLELQSIPVAPVIESALGETELAIREADVVVQSDVESELPPVMADPLALQQCLQNFITNAIKYGGEERWIGIRAVAGRGADHPFVLITVADRGPGIRSEEAQRIFDPFYQGETRNRAKARGVGLGLSLTKNIMEAMGGKVTVVTGLGKGSRFTLHVRRVGGENEKRAAD